MSANGLPLFHSKADIAAGLISTPPDPLGITHPQSTSLCICRRRKNNGTGASCRSGRWQAGRRGRRHVLRHVVRVGQPRSRSRPIPSVTSSHRRDHAFRRVGDGGGVGGKEALSKTGGRGRVVGDRAPIMNRLDWSGQQSLLPKRVSRRREIADLFDLAAEAETGFPSPRRPRLMRGYSASAPCAGATILRLPLDNWLRARLCGARRERVVRLVTAGPPGKTDLPACDTTFGLWRLPTITFWAVAGSRIEQDPVAASFADRT